VQLSILFRSETLSMRTYRTHQTHRTLEAAKTLTDMQRVFIQVGEEVGWRIAISCNNWICH
jgi:hypothetical protein